MRIVYVGHLATALILLPDGEPLHVNRDMPVEIPDELATRLLEQAAWQPESVDSDPPIEPVKSAKRAGKADS